MAQHDYDERRIHSLMESAANCSQNDQRAWAVLLDQLERLCRGNEAMRLQLLKMVQASGEGKQGDAKKPPIRDDIELVLWVEECVNRVEAGRLPVERAGRGGIQYALDHLSEGPGENRYPQDPKALRKRYSSALKRVSQSGYGMRGR